MKKYLAKASHLSTDFSKSFASVAISLEQSHRLKGGSDDDNSDGIIIIEEPIG